jgi:hypothetical protein
VRDRFVCVESISFENGSNAIQRLLCWCFGSVGLPGNDQCEDVRHHHVMQPFWGDAGAKVSWTSARQRFIATDAVSRFVAIDRGCEVLRLLAVTSTQQTTSSKHASASARAEKCEQMQELVFQRSWLAAAFRPPSMTPTSAMRRLRFVEPKFA